MGALFTAVVTWFTLHELDAIRQREWRFFFASVPASDETAFRVFTALHVPVFLLVLSALDSPSFQVGFDAFMLLHAGAHGLLRDHPRLHFDTWFSWVWIYGGGLLGAAHLLTVV